MTQVGFLFQLNSVLEILQYNESLAYVLEGANSFFLQQM